MTRKNRALGSSGLPKACLTSELSPIAALVRALKDHKWNLLWKVWLRARAHQLLISLDRKYQFCFVEGGGGSAHRYCWFESYCFEKNVCYAHYYRKVFYLTALIAYHLLWVQCALLVFSHNFWLGCATELFEWNERQESSLKLKPLLLCYVQLMRSQSAQAFTKLYSLEGNFASVRVKNKLEVLEQKFISDGLQRRVSAFEGGFNHLSGSIHSEVMTESKKWALCTLSIVS